MNLNQTTTKIDETWGIASPLPREHIPKRSRPKDLRIVRIMGEIKRDWGFLKHSRNRGNHGKELVDSSQSSAPKTKLKFHQTRHKTRRWIDSNRPEGTRRLGPPFPIKSTRVLTQTTFKSTLKRCTEEEEHRGGGLGKQRIHGHNTKAALDLTQVKGYLYPRDRSDRLVRQVRPVSGTGQIGWPAAPPVHDLIRRL